MPIGLKYPKLLRIEKALELPMLLLSFVWLCVLITELVLGMDTLLSLLGDTLWVLFVLYLGLRLLTVASPVSFLKRNWLFILAILVSVLRFFPSLQGLASVRAVTATFGVQVIWIFATANLGMSSLRRMLGIRGTGYAVAFTLVVIFTGAAGMLYFERSSGSPQAMRAYPEAVWWTAMQLTNIGSAYSPVTTGGRVLCLGISVYAAAMFGYLTAIIATMFMDRVVNVSKADRQRDVAIADISRQLSELRQLIEKALESR